jgi:TusA-related sulfurtransferase
LWNSALSVTDNDEIYIIGTTESTEDIATENAFQSSFIDGFGTFIAKFEPCPDPVLPVAETSQNFQPGETLGDLEVETVEWSGSDPIVTWYADAAGTQILSPDTELEAETTYYVSQKIQGCDESGLLAISVETLSVSENKLAKTALFPNPNDGDFYLSGLPNGPLEIVMYDILGKKVYRQNLQQAGQRHRISPAIHFSDGVYFLKIYNGYTSKVFKVVIQ